MNINILDHLPNIKLCKNLIDADKCCRHKYLNKEKQLSNIKIRFTLSFNRNSIFVEINLLKAEVTFKAVEIQTVL